MHKKMQSIMVCSVLAATLCGVLFALGCSPTEDLNGESSVGEVSSDALMIDESSVSSSLKTTPSAVRRDLGSAFKIEADVAIPDVDACFTFDAALLSWDPSDIFQVFGIDGLVEGDSEKGYFLSGNGSLALAEGNILFRANDFPLDYYDIAFYPLGFSASKGFYSNQDLLYQSREDALIEVTSVCDQLGVNDVVLREALALDWETLNERAQATREQYSREQISSVVMSDESYERIFSDSDEAYHFQMSEHNLGVPLTAHSYVNAKNERPFLGTRIELYMNEPGVIFFYATSLFDLSNLKNVKEVDKIVSLEDALNRVEEKYGSIVTSNVVTIDHIAFEYVPIAANSDESQGFVPAWVFSSGYDSVNQPPSVFVNALTGEVF